MRKRAAAGQPRITFHDIRAKALQTHAHVVPPDIQDAVDRRVEAQDLEYKDWVDLRDPVARAEIAKDLAALSNYGGGYLVFGITDEGECSANPPQSLDGFDAEAFNLIVDKYLTPTFQCESFTARPTAGGDLCVVVRVPPHRSVPVCARADGPLVDGKHRGVRIGRYYTRAPQPRSVPIESPDQWKDIIRRCVVFERDVLLREIARILAVAPASTR
jgi:hypothetical protein